MSVKDLVKILLSIQQLVILYLFLLVLFYALAYQMSGGPAQYGGAMVMKVEAGAGSMQMADHTQQQQQQQQYTQQQQLIQMQQGRKNMFIFDTTE